ncbi:STAS domain-containing protein [Tropicimonas sediminicola]|uniref:Sulfate permease, MFS superfamily n=1 Tax=Tropicimonas sediminicola TaxID=1031541 RepID=A0A239LP17_9RHOB|nr:STAS domain-containing protein [Tropicimonas sediminicola]SNT32105.1 Sulfate permease, MFS superfamily [Tropicimonas sediminicola]
MSKPKVPGAPLVLSAARGLLAGGLAALVAAFYLVSFVQLMVLPVAPEFLNTALTFAFAASAVTAVLVVFQTGSGGVVWQAQSIAVVALQAPVAEIAAAMSGAPPEAAFATLAALLSATAVLAGLGMAAIGFLRGGALGKAVPHPVLGAFLASAGAMLVYHALHGLSGPASGWLTAEAAAAWGPPFAIALLCLAVSRLPWGRRLEPVLLIAGAAATAALMRGEQGAEPMSGLSAELPLLTGPVAWNVVLGQMPAAAAAAGLAVLSVLMNLTSLDRMPREPIDIDRTLRRCLPVNMIAALVSGIVTFPSYTLTRLAWSVAPRSGRFGEVAMACVAVLILVVGVDALARLPQAFFAFLLIYLGVGILHRWLWVEARRMPPPDTLLMIAILGVTLAYGFGPGIAAGLLAGSIRFTLAYARLPVLRAAYDARLRLSSTERGPTETRRLIDAGRETSIVHLAGFMFFGSVRRIETDLARALRPEGRRRVLLDLSAVRGVDISAAEAIHQSMRRAKAVGAEIVLCGMSPAVARDLARAGDGPLPSAPDLDTALRQVEEEILCGALSGSATDSALTQILRRIEALGPEGPPMRRELRPGDALFLRGEAAESFAMLEQGRLVATLGAATIEGERVAHFLPGAVVGEIGFLTGGTRTANVIAETPCVVFLVSRDAIERLKRADPAAALELLELIGSAVAQRLARTTALLHIHQRPPGAKRR